MKACNYNYEKETSRKKARGCLQCFVLFQKSFHILLGQLLSFYVVFMARSFSIPDEVSESKKEKT